MKIEFIKVNFAMKKYIYAKANPIFTILFKKEKKRLKKIIKSNIEIEHIGSTAIPGLGGKEILDILIGTESKTIKKIQKELQQDGYKFSKKASTKDRLFLKKEIEIEDKKIMIHIHLTIYDNDIYNELLFFRDYLKKHPTLIKKYIKIKKEAVKKANENGKIYREYKKGFIEDILKKSSNKK